MFHVPTKLNMDLIEISSKNPAYFSIQRNCVPPVMLWQPGDILPAVGITNLDSICGTHSTRLTISRGQPHYTPLTGDRAGVRDSHLITLSLSFLHLKRITVKRKEMLLKLT